MKYEPNPNHSPTKSQKKSSKSSKSPKTTPTKTTSNRGRGTPSKRGKKKKIIFHKI